MMENETLSFCAHGVPNKMMSCSFCMEERIANLEQYYKAVATFAYVDAFLRILEHRIEKLENLLEACIGNHNLRVDDIVALRKRTTELEEQVKALQQNPAADESQDLIAPINRITKEEFAKKYSNAGESQEGCPCDCHNRITVGSTALGCFACQLYHITFVDVTPKKTKTYWVNVYEDTLTLPLDCAYRANIFASEQTAKKCINEYHSRYLKTISFTIPIDEAE